MYVLRGLRQRRRRKHTCASRFDLNLAWNHPEQQRARGYEPDMASFGGATAITIINVCSGGRGPSNLNSARVTSAAVHAFNVMPCINVL